MAEENHGQMLIQQQPSQQSHMQSTQLQPAQMQQSQQPQMQQSQQPQMQQSQLQQSQMQQQAQLQQQSQIQPSQMQQLQQSQLQQSQMQQTQMQQQAQLQQLQQSQLQQPQIQQSQLQQPQIQQSQLQQSQLQQSQLQQSQLQQSQLQQSSPMQPQPQQQGVTATMSVEQSNMNVTTTVPLNVATINVSQPQQMQSIQQSVNTSSGTPVQMAVSQLTAQGQTLPAGAMMSQSSGPHPTMMHPTMTMAAQTPMQQVQVIQPSYLQHVYPQQQIMFPGNLTLQHAGMGASTLQNLSAQGLSLQLQAKTTLDPKTSGTQSIQAVNAANKQGLTVNAGTMMTASGQVIGTAQKANFPQQMMTGPGKSTIIHNQPGFAPGNTNQTVVIGQLLPNQQPIFNHKAIADSQKGKFTFQNQPTALQPKSLYSSAMPVHSSAQVFNGSQLKQISSQPQMITTQAPGTMFSQAHQLLGLQTLPHGLSWAPHGSFPSALLGQNPIIIRSQQSDMFIQQSQPQAAMHLPIAAAAQSMPNTSFAPTPAIAPQKQKQVKMRPVTTHSVAVATHAVATQTHVSNAATMHSNTTPVRSQIKPKSRTPIGAAPGVMPAPIAPQTVTSQTQTNQCAPQTLPQMPQQKSDAGNQTYARTAGADAKNIVLPTKDGKLPSPKSQAMVAPSTKMHLQLQPMADPSLTSTMVTVSSTTPVLTNTTVQVNSGVSTVNAISSSTPSLLPIEAKTSYSLSKMESDARKTEAPPQSVVSSVQAETKDASSVVEPLKHQQTTMKPLLGQVKDKQPPQKAIVKPQILTHVIDGFVIQEGPEPFPVSRSALLDSPGRMLPIEKVDPHLKRKDSPAVASPDKRLKIHRARGGPGRKKKMGGYRGRKSLRKQVDMEEEAAPEEESLDTTAEDMAASEKLGDDSTEASTDVPQDNLVELENADVEINKIGLDPTQKLPNKWTVQDVYDFIHNLPGCSDYADTFKSQEIDGQALLLLKEDHLMTSMCMKLGPALKLISQIRSMKEEVGET